MSSSAPSSPGPMTRSRARRALAPEPAASDNKAPPQDPPSPSPAPKDVVQAQKKDPKPFKYLALPQRVRALVNGFVDERPLLFSPPSPTLLALSETCRLAHTETRSLVWSTVVYKPSDLIAASGDPLKRDLKQLKKIDQRAPLLVQRLAVDGLAPGHLSRLGAAAAADYGLKEASRAIKLLKNFASHSLRKLRLSDFTVSCRDAERLVAQIAISSVDTLVMGRVRASCAEDGASTHWFPLHSPAPRLKQLEIIDGPDCFLDLVGQASSLESLTIVSTVYPIAGRHVGYIVKALASLVYLSIESAGAGYAVHELFKALSVPSKAGFPLQELLVKSSMASPDLNNVALALQRFPSLVRLALHGCGPYTLEFVAELVLCAPGIQALSLVSGDGSSTRKWAGTLDDYMAELTHLEHLQYLCWDRADAPAVTTSPQRPSVRELIMLLTVAEACKSLAEMFVVSGNTDEGLTGRAATFHDNATTGDVQVTRRSLHLAEFSNAQEEWLSAV